jgi:hypothetical protein
VVLFKASRGVRLERVYEAVRERVRSRRAAPVRETEQGARETEKGVVPGERVES